MRPLDKVIEATLKLVPEDYAAKQDLAQQLESIKESYLYAAPEMHPMWWYEFGTVLKNTFGDSDAPWTNEIVELVQGKTDYLKILGG